MSLSGSPSRAMMSACMPGATVPISFCMFNLSAACIRCGTNRGPIRMDQSAQPLGFGFRTCGLELFVGQRLAAALADAARGEYLHQISAISLELADGFADLFRR